MSFDGRFGSKAAVPAASGHVSLWATSGRSGCLFPNHHGLKQVTQLQIKTVASPGFGPIFGVLARNGLVFGKGGFESPQPTLSSPLRAIFLPAQRSTKQ
jgi:hypothetical protein